MKLIIARHGEAEMFSSSGMDRNRQLTEKGKSDILKMSLFIQKSPIKINQIYYSPYDRTRNTAEIFSQNIGMETKLIEENCLAPGGNYDSILKRICSFSNSEGILLVGHNPDVSFFAAKLIQDPTLSHNLIFQPGTTIALNIAREKFCNGQILWVLSPDFLG
ncbi:MAG: phosphohistidine phosphatase SixA [Leptospiraceae bacterium]|nr:phosphohistidine phosphatase SixA [Leptospiraceae bacterium]